MSRIKSDKVHIGNDYVLNSNEKSLNEIYNKQKLILDEAKAKAKQIILEAHKTLEEAKNQAQTIIEKATNEANSQAELILKKAFEDGSQKGFEEGKIQAYKEITKELEDKIINVDNFAKSTFEIKKKIIRSAYSDVLELVMLVAEKIIKKNLEENSDILLNIINEASSKLNCEDETIKIITNPKMYEKLVSISERIQNEIPKLKNISIIEDNNVSSDGVIIESLSNRVDATLSSCINELTEKLFNELKSTQDEDIINDFENE